MAVVAVTKESRAGETRVAMTPDSVKRLKALGLDVIVEAGSGADCYFADADYEAAGATLAASGAEAVKDADILLKVRAPDARFQDLLRRLHLTPDKQY